MPTAFLKSLDASLSAAACLLASAWPRADRASTGKTLILRPGGLGDLVCADIALQELGLDARDFTWLVEKRSRPWAEFRGLPHRCYDENPWKTLAEARGGYSLVINTEQRFGLAEAYGLWARGKGGRLVSFATNRGASWSNLKVAYDWRDRHETVEFGRLFAAALNLPEPTGPRLSRPRLHPASGPPLVLIAGRQSRSRRLTVEAWAKLISEWHQDRKFLIAAAPQDADFAAELSRRFDGLATPFQGSFDVWCGQISRSEEVFTMDGGGVHIASFFGVATLAFFSSGRAQKWFPLGEGSQILRRHDLACQPCTKFGQVPPCPYGYACLNLEGVVPTNAGVSGGAQDIAKK